MKGCRVAASCVAFALLVSGRPAIAQSDDLGSRIVRGIVGLFSHDSAVEHARKAWLLIDAEIQGCVAAKTHVQPNEMINEGVGPDDERVAPSIEACRREAEEAKARDAQAAASLAAQRQARRKARKPPHPAATAAKAAGDDKLRDPVAPYTPQTTSPVESGRVRMGMTREQVVAVRGAPQRKAAVPPDYELWHYAAGDVAFTNGRVSYVGH